MWCELATVLGGTVSDLQSRMSHAEWTRWLAYRKTHGPLSFDRRYDRPAAAQIYHHALMRGVSPDSVEEFMPYTEKPGASVDDIARELGALARKR